MHSWKGAALSSMDLHAAGARYGAPFWDFHRANLHRCLLTRAVSLGTTIRVNARVTTLEDGGRTAVLWSGERIASDLVIAADGIHSQMREWFVGRADPPRKTGDLAYRLLLGTEKMLADAELRGMVEVPGVDYWLGPRKHAVCYVLRGGKQVNVVLLVPDDLAEGESVVRGDVETMRAMYEGWDPRITKMLALAEDVMKWRLCVRTDDLKSWGNEEGTFVMIGDAVHATLPYLASG